MKTMIPPRLAGSLLIILLLQLQAFSQRIQFGKSYVNITKGVSGGTIEVGDILEIRATIAVGNFTAVSIDRARYNDTIPANTTYVPGSLKIVTNEGLTVRSFTDVSDADQGFCNNSFLRINMGSTYNGNNPGSVNLGGSATGAGTGFTGGGVIRNNGRPSFYGGVCIMSASYRIQINAVSFGTIINAFGGAFRFRLDGTNQIVGLPPYSIGIAENLGLCQNSIGGNAIIEDGGTFGSGDVQNRTVSGIVPGYGFGPVAYNFPNDGSYSIVNNLSPNGSVNPNSDNPDNAATDAASSRVFRLWDIIGDHTGSASGTGNAPVAPGSSGGYFVAINASYANNNAIQQTISGLCPNTYYEFSAWFKNVCKYCACDSTADAPYRTVSGVRVPNTNFNGPDSSGVNPNLTFTIDGVDYYTSGALQYTGQWVKRGFVYRTGASQNSFTVTIRNNAPGGGGNDWAIDDVSVATCTPNLNLVPSGNTQVCYGNQVDLATTVRSYYPNYMQWSWEKSIDGGASWISTGRTGTSTPVLVDGEYEYTDYFPSFLADSAVHNNIFRIRVASSSDNLAEPSCSFTNSARLLVLVNNCMYVLDQNQVTVTGEVQRSLATIKWKTYSGAAIRSFDIERSTDKYNFTRVGTIEAGSTTEYSFVDPLPVTGPVYYRIRINGSSAYIYSRLVLLSSGDLEFKITSLTNPVSSSISFELHSPHTERVDIIVRDNYGRIVKQFQQQVLSGLNQIKFNSTGLDASGSYMLQISSHDKSITKRIIKAGH